MNFFIVPLSIKSFAYQLLLHQERRFVLPKGCWEHPVIRGGKGISSQKNNCRRVKNREVALGLTPAACPSRPCGPQFIPKNISCKRSCFIPKYNLKETLEILFKIGKHAVGSKSCQLAASSYQVVISNEFTTANKAFVMIKYIYRGE